jgi:hypothetical protein
MERGETSAYFGGSSIFLKGISEESVPLTRLIFDDPFDDSHHIFVARLNLPIPLWIIS